MLLHVASFSFMNIISRASGVMENGASNNMVSLSSFPGSIHSVRRTGRDGAWE